MIDLILKSGRGLPHSKTLARYKRPWNWRSFWSAPALWRFQKLLQASLLVIAVSSSATLAFAETPIGTAEQRAIAFLEREVPSWSKDNGCFSCHNNGDAAQALYLAWRMGLRFDRRALDETTAWLQKPERWKDNKGDPGFSDQRLANLQFAAGLAAALETGAATNRKALEIAATMVAGDQDANGTWSIERHNPAGSPCTYGTALATYIGWRTLKSSGAAGVSNCVQKAETWLARLPINNVISAATVLSFELDSGLGRKARIDECVTFLEHARSSDGAWGPYPDSPPEVFDTALALLALSKLRPPERAKMIGAGRQFLIRTQNEDGGWPATTRPSRGESYAQQISTTAWALIALLQTREHKPAKAGTTN